MRKEDFIVVFAIALAALSFFTQWTYVDGAMPFGMALFRGQVNWMSATLVGVPVAALLLLLLNRVAWLPVVGIIGLIPFVYFIGNIAWESYKLASEGNFLVQRDEFFMFRFFSIWLWIHFGVSILFALACFYPSSKDEGAEEIDVQTIAS